jgi:membrane-bound lytic murein transglycosylase MltF
MNGALWIPRAAQAQAESGWDPQAQSWIVNKAGVRVPCAFGLFQFTLPTWKTWGDASTSPLQPDPAIRANSRYMPWLEARTGQDRDKALGAYNAGLGTIQKAERLAAMLGLSGEDAWLQALPRVSGVANANQTRTYLSHNKAYAADIQRKVKP